MPSCGPWMPLEQRTIRMLGAYSAIAALVASGLARRPPFCAPLRAFPRFQGRAGRSARLLNASFGIWAVI